MTEKEQFLLNKGIKIEICQPGHFFRVKVTDNGKVKISNKAHTWQNVKVAKDKTIDYFYDLIK